MINRNSSRFYDDIEPVCRYEARLSPEQIQLIEMRELLFSQKQRNLVSPNYDKRYPSMARIAKLRHDQIIMYLCVLDFSAHKNKNPEQLQMDLKMP